MIKSSVNRNAFPFLEGRREGTMPSMKYLMLIKDSLYPNALRIDVDDEILGFISKSLSFPEA